MTGGVPMQFHQNCRKQRPKLSMAASGRLNYAAKAYQKGGTRFQLGTETVLPGETKALFTSEGYGYISMLSLEIPQTHDGVYLAVHSHGAKQIDLPVRNMFMSGIDGRETQSMFAGKYVEESGPHFFTGICFCHMRTAAGSSCSIQRTRRLQ